MAAVLESVTDNCSYSVMNCISHRIVVLMYGTTEPRYVAPYKCLLA